MFHSTDLAARQREDPTLNRLLRKFSNEIRGKAFGDCPRPHRPRQAAPPRWVEIALSGAFCVRLGNSLFHREFLATGRGALHHYEGGTEDQNLRHQLGHRRTVESERRPQVSDGPDVVLVRRLWSAVAAGASPAPRNIRCAGESGAKRGRDYPPPRLDEIAIS